MPPAIPFRTPHRTIANVLLDLRHARKDWDAALADADCAAREGLPRLEEECGDRMCEADDRIAELRAEFAAMFATATGVTWPQVELAITEGLL